MEGEWTTDGRRVEAPWKRGAAEIAFTVSRASCGGRAAELVGVAPLRKLQEGVIKVSGRAVVRSRELGELRAPCHALTVGGHAAGKTQAMTIIIVAVVIIALLVMWGWRGRG